MVDQPEHPHPAQVHEAFSPLRDEEWPAAIADMREGFAGDLNVYRVMARHPALMQAWQNLRNHVVRASALSSCHLELVILRVGHHWKSNYEWAHHVVRGRAAGLSDAQIGSAALPATDTGSATERLLFQAVDELLTNGKLCARTAESLHKALGPHGVLDLVATVGMYTTLAFIVKSFETPIDVNVNDALDKAPLSVPVPQP